MKTVSTIINQLQDKHYLEFANSYAEPGYSDPEKGILFMDWNEVDDRIPEILEKAGFAIEWSDEWIVDYDNDCKAYRTSPDGYGWICQVKFCDGYFLTPDNDIEEWIEECKSTDYNQIHSALSDWIREEDLAEHGYQKWNGTYESGFHPGQNDDPTKIYQEIEENIKNLDSVVFRIASTGQFDVHFEAYYKISE